MFRRCASELALVCPRVELSNSLAISEAIKITTPKVATAIACCNVTIVVVVVVVTVVIICNLASTISRHSITRQMKKANKGSYGY